MERKYKVKVYCLNCRFEGIINISFGDVVQKYKCPKCGEYKLMDNRKG